MNCQDQGEQNAWYVYRCFALKLSILRFWPVASWPKLRLPLCWKPSIVEQNGARFCPQGNMQLAKTHFGCFETFVTKIPYYQSPETSIADISKTVDRRAKRSSISTPRALRNCPKCRRPLAAGSQKPSQISFYNFTGTLYGPISLAVFFLFWSDLFWPFYGL